MSKKKLFDDDSDEDIDLKTENEYAKKYDTWREKEEIHKLEQKYGPDAINADGSLSSDSDDESDEPLEVSEETEAEFLKTLALLKTKDPRIYDPNFKCFQEDEQKETVKETKSKTITFEDSDEDSDQDGDIFKIEKKAEVEETIEMKDDTKSNKKKAGKIKQYLTGQAEHIDEEVEKDLAPLKALWSDPKLNEGEAFLRDYILNKKYLEEGEVGEAAGRARDDDALEADEATVEEQTKFERAYNFRFEEPDEEYLKRFPRTMNYIRPKDDRRARKRAEVRERKDEEKRKRMEEIGRLKALKLKEIQEKIAKIKEVTGNQNLAFKEEDIEGDFDPSEYDRRMRALFDEQFYGQADDTKPVFPDLDEELEIENWDNYEVDNQDGAPNQDEDGPHCEDEDFNMDAEYDPKRSRQNLLEEIQKTLGKKRRNRKRQSKLSQLLASEKPKFVPLAADRTYAEHMQEYYRLDCEDVVGGMPTRFKYREVLPNDYGLSVEEILLADDKELTQWVPLKKVVKYRPEAAEKGDLNTYRLRANDERLKRKLLPSLYRDLPQEPEVAVPLEQTKKKKKKRKNKNADETNEDNFTENEGASQNNVDNGNNETTAHNISEDISNKKRKKHELKQHNSNDTATENTINENVEDTSENKKSKRKRKLKNAETIDVSNKNESDEINDNDISTKTKKVKKKSKNKNIFNVSSDTLVDEANTRGETVKKKKSKNKTKLNNPDTGKLNINKQVKEDNLSNNVENNVSPEIYNKITKKKQKIKGNKAANDNSGKVEKKSEKILNKKNKFKNKKKFKSKENTSSSDNPLGKLSDERLKAYGLNPKKYRGFLKYKKF